MQAKCVYYERSGAACEVLVVEEMPVRPPGPGEVFVRLRCSGGNPANVKVPAGAPGRKMAYARIVPHHDGSGVAEAVGPGADPKLVGQRAWTYCSQYQRHFGTSAQ